MASGAVSYDGDLPFARRWGSRTRPLPRDDVVCHQFRFDDILLINTHVNGVWAAQSPVLRLECNQNPVFQFYADTFDRVWGMAGPGRSPASRTGSS